MSVLQIVVNIRDAEHEQFAHEQALLAASSYCSRVLVLAASTKYSRVLAASTKCSRMLVFATSSICSCSL